MIAFCFNIMVNEQLRRTHNLICRPKRPGFFFVYNNVFGSVDILRYTFIMFAQFKSQNKEIHLWIRKY